MDVSLLSTLIESSIPANVTFNEYGVAQRGLRYTFSYKRLNVTLDVCAINGLWGGSINIMTNLWGMGGPITRSDFKHSSFETCVTNLWLDALNYINRNKENVVKEAIRFEKELQKWLGSSEEEKYRLFKDTYFYEKI